MNDIPVDAIAQAVEMLGADGATEDLLAALVGDDQDARRLREGIPECPRPGLGFASVSHHETAEMLSGA